MEPAEIIASVNWENAVLQDQNHQLRINVQQTGYQLSEVYALNVAFQEIFQAQAHEMLMAYEEINRLSQKIQFQYAYIANVEKQSEEARLACQQATAIFHQQITAENWSRAQWSQSAQNLSAEAEHLHQTVFAKIDASDTNDEKATELMNKITELKSSALLKELQHNELKRMLRIDRERLEQMHKDSFAMIETRDDLNRRLASTNERLRSQTGKSKRDLGRVQEEKQRLERELEDAVEVFKKHKETEKQLSEAIENAERLQSKHRAALADTETYRSIAEFYKGQDKNQMDIVSQLKRKVQDLENAERKEGYLKTISEQKAEIEQLVLGRTELKKTIEKKERIVVDSLAKMVQQTKLAQEAKKEVATYRGYAMAPTESLLGSLSKNSLKLGSEIVTTVFNMLKDIDSQEKAAQAIGQMSGYLTRQRQTVVDYIQEAASNACKVTDMIESLLENIPEKVGPKAIEGLIAFVKALRNDLENGIKQSPR